MGESDDAVRIYLNEPHQVREYGKSYYLTTASGADEIQLPIKLTDLERNADGLVTAIIIPQWLAERRKWINAKSGSSPIPSKKEDDEMTRYDWFLLGSTIATVIRHEGMSTRDATWEASLMAQKLMEYSDKEREDE